MVSNFIVYHFVVTNKPCEAGGDGVIVIVIALLYALVTLINYMKSESEILHWGPPPDLLSYWQEIGRCARDGGEGKAVSYHFCLYILNIFNYD